MKNPSQFVEDLRVAATANKPSKPSTDELTASPAFDVYAELARLRQQVEQLLPRPRVAVEFKIGDRISLIKLPDMAGTVEGLPGRDGRIFVRYDFAGANDPLATVRPEALQLYDARKTNGVNVRIGKWAH